MAGKSRVSWADIHSEDSSSFQKKPEKEFPGELPTRISKSPPPSVFPVPKKLTQQPRSLSPVPRNRRNFRRPSAPLPAADDSYASGIPDLENSRSGLNADLKNFGILLPKKGIVVVEDSNTLGAASRGASQGGVSQAESVTDQCKRTISEVSTHEQQAKRARGAFPVDPVFGGPMPSRSTTVNSELSKSE